jgi:endonuclease IV
MVWFFVFVVEVFMKDIRYLMGPHVGGSHEALSQTIPDLYSSGVRVFQIFFSSPRVMELPSEETKSLIRGLPKDLSLIVHSPYLVNLIGRSKMWGLTLSYEAKAVEICAELGIPYYLTHLGAFSKDRGEGREEALDNALDFCTKLLKLTDGSPVKILLENDSGSKSGTKCGDVPFVYNIVKRVGDPRLRMAIDTEHAYAHGFDLSKHDRLKKAFTVTELVHLNAIPDYVEFGGHLDRHSDTVIEDTVNRKLITDVVLLALEVGLPMIFERRDVGLFYRDVAFLAPFIKQYVSQSGDEISLSTL